MGFTVGTVTALHDFIRGLPTICEDIARRAQADELMIARSTGRLERMKRANEMTRTRLQSDLEQASVRLEQFQRAFNALRCQRE